MGRLEQGEGWLLGPLVHSTACPRQPRCCLSWGQLGCPVYTGTQTFCPSPLGMSAFRPAQRASSAPQIPSSPGPQAQGTGREEQEQHLGWGEGERSKCTHLFSRTKAKRIKFLSFYFKKDKNCY